jgi:putative membrane protein
MHPFYGPSARLMSDRTGRPEGIASMAAYLAFWAVVVALGKRELDARWPRGAGERPATGDPALEALRVRYARGDIDRDIYLAMRSDLTAGGASDRPS